MWIFFLALLSLKVKWIDKSQNISRYFIDNAAFWLEISFHAHTRSCVVIILFHFAWFRLEYNVWRVIYMWFGQQPLVACCPYLFAIITTHARFVRKTRQRCTMFANEKSNIFVFEFVHTQKSQENGVTSVREKCIKDVTSSITKWNEKEIRKKQQQQQQRWSTSFQKYWFIRVHSYVSARFPILSLFYLLL